MGEIILIVIVEKRKSEQDKDRGGENCTAEVLSCKKMKQRGDQKDVEQCM